MKKVLTGVPDLVSETLYSTDSKEARTKDECKISGLDCCDPQTGAHAPKRPSCCLDRCLRSQSTSCPAQKSQQTIGTSWCPGIYLGDSRGRDWIHMALQQPLDLSKNKPRIGKHQVQGRMAHPGVVVEDDARVSSGIEHVRRFSI